MKTLTTDEAVKWCVNHKIAVDAKGDHEIAFKGYNVLRFEIPQAVNRVYWLSNVIQEKLQPWDQCLLWVTAWGIWESSENWHLYYRLRRSYADDKLIEEAPGHLFLGNEKQDFVSFLQLGLQYGWDVCLFPENSNNRAFASHDGWVELAMVDQVDLEKTKRELRESEIILL